MNRQLLAGLLTVTQVNDYTWTAIIPEMTLMWANGHSEEEARENWLKQYDQPYLTPIFKSILQKRREHPLIVIEDSESRKVTQRPTFVDFPYRGKLYRIATNEGLPKRCIVLPNGVILVVCQWTGRVPAALADVRRSPEPVLPEDIAAQLDGVLAEEIPLLPDQSTHPMAVLDFEGQRYAIDYDSRALVEFPDGRLYRIRSVYPEEPVHIVEMVPFDPSDSYMSYQLEAFGKTPARAVAPDYPGMAHEPRDLRIRFSFHNERFVLSHEAYEQGKWIVYVPDHGFYRIGAYLESSPVQLGDLSPLPVDQIDPNGVVVASRFADAVNVEPW